MPLDPSQKFVVSTISREDIVGFIEPYTGEVSVDPTDPRLSDEFCEEYANGLYQIETDTVGMSEDTQEEAEMAWAEQMAAKFDALAANVDGTTEQSQEHPADPQRSTAGQGSLLTDDQKTLLSEILTDEFERSCETASDLPEDERPTHLDYIKSLIELRLALEQAGIVAASGWTLPD